MIVREDYKAFISNEELAVITSNDSSIRATAEKSAEATIKTLLDGQYDVDTIFAQIGEARNRTILTWQIYLTLYILYQRIGKDKVPEDRYEQYSSAMEGLKKVAKDKINTTLPRRLDPQTGQTLGDSVRYGNVQDLTDDYY